MPVRIIDEIDINCPEDFDIFIPRGLEGSFTIKEFAKAAGVTYDCAQRAVNILTYLERLLPCGKRGRENLYTLPPSGGRL